MVLIQPPKGKIVNPRTNEEGTVEMMLPQTFTKWPTNYVDQVSIDERLRSLGIDKESSAFGRWQDSGSWANFLTYLVALEVAFTDRDAFRDADVVVVLRPDLRIEGRLHITSWVVLAWFLSRFRKNTALVPSWSSHNGFNDRFAILSSQVTPTYLTRVGRVREHFAKKPRHNSEQFLKAVMSESLVAQIIATPMFRIRIGGIPEPSDVKYARERNLRAKTRELLRKLT
jgi:hypothetical protein